MKLLEFIGKKEGLQLPSGFADRIAQQSNRSMRRAILSFETCRVQQLSSGLPILHMQKFPLKHLDYNYFTKANILLLAPRYPFTVNQAIPPMDWEEYVSEIASSIFKEQSPKRFNIRILFA